MWKNYNVSEEILEEDGNGETNTFIMGKWNSVVGDKSYQNTVRPHVLGRRNQIKRTSTSMKGMDLSSPIHGLKSLREDCTPGKHQEIEVNISLTIYL